MYITDKKLEGWGLILILISFGWQFIEVNLADISNDVDKYQLHKKIDALYMIISDAYSHSEFNSSEVRSSVDFEHIAKEWKHWSSLKVQKESVSNQLQWTLYFKSIIFIVGSILLIIPKFRKT